MEITSRKLAQAVKHAVYAEEELTLQQKARVFFNIVEFIGERLAQIRMREEEQDERND